MAPSHGLPAAALSHLDASAAPSVAVQSVQRSLADRYTVSADEVGRLIAAAIEVMRVSGTDSPRVGDIVATSGLSNQTFYRYFKTKEEFLLAVLDDGLRRLVGYLSHDLDKHTSGITKVGRWINGIMMQAVNPSAAAATRGVLANSSQLMYRFADQFDRSEEVLKEPLRQALVTAREQQEIPACDDVTLSRHVEMIYRMVMGAMQYALSGRHAPTQDDIDHLIAFTRRGLDVRDDRVNDREIGAEGATGR
jgi:AcrR family transcriptional regulator